MNLKPAKTAASLVVIGPVNPAMFHPEWFKANELIRAAEADEAEVKIVSAEITIFKAEWLEVDVRQNRIQLRTTQEPYYPILRDLMAGCLAALPRVPFDQIGFNWENVYHMPSAETYHALGHRLAPKGEWGESLVNPGLVSLTIRSERSDDRDGFRNFSIKPNLQSNVDYEVILAVNDHVSFIDEKPQASERVRDCILEYWDRSRADFDAVANDVMRQS